jgi:hypothetical protein
MEKRCTKCGQIKALVEFGNLKKGKEGKCSYCKECAKKDLKEWTSKNQPQVKQRSKDYLSKRRKEDSEWYFKEILRNQVRRYVVSKKGIRTEEILGETYSNVRVHIERQFKEGMSWHNHGEWHIDHIVPLTSGNKREEWIALNHYTNLQPLWAADNLKKGAKITSGLV